MTTQQIPTADTAKSTRLQEPGDHEKFSHYVPKAEIEAAILDGRPATALCGKKWIPQRDPKSFPVCPDCQAQWVGLRDE